MIASARYLPLLSLWSFLSLRIEGIEGFLGGKDLQFQREKYLDARNLRSDRLQPTLVGRTSSFPRRTRTNNEKPSRRHPQSWQKGHRMAIDEDLDQIIDVRIQEANAQVVSSPPLLSIENMTTTTQREDATNEQSVPILSQLKDSVFLGIEPTPSIIAIMTIYFVEGALGLAQLAQTFLLKDELHLGPAEMSALTGVFALPWTIKPLYGFLSDGLPLWGYRRRSYLILAGIIGAIAYAQLGSNFGGLLPIDEIGSSSEGGLTLTATVASLLVSSACIACSDVVADGMVVQQTRDSEDPKVAGGLQSLCWGSRAIGGLLASYFSGSLLEVISPRQVFSITATLPLLVAMIAFLIDEKPVRTAINESSEEDSAQDDLLLDGVGEQVEALWSAIRQPSIWRPALFMFLWQSTPTSDGAFLYFMTNDLGMGPEFLGRVRLVSSVAGLVGVWAYQQFFRTTPIKDILFWSSIASFPLGMSSLLLITHANRALGIPDGAFVFGDDVALAILGEIAFLPTLVLAARLCPPGVEAVLFATLMSIFNSASTVGTEVGAALTKVFGVTESNFDNLGMLTFICNLTSLYPLLFIGWLDGIGDQSEEELEAEGGES